jgi:FMN phosphatase YigB (HAD superfamily)
MFRNVNFDIDDTLYNAENAYKEAYEAVERFLVDNNYSYTDLQISREIVKIKSPHNRNRLYYFLEAVKQPELALKCYDIYYETLYSSIKPFNGVKELFDLFQQENVTIRCITDFDTVIQLNKLKKLDLLKQVNYVLTSEETLTEKPSQLMFPLQYSGLMIGDSYKKDIRGALQARWCAIHICSKTQFEASDKLLTFGSMQMVREFFQIYIHHIKALVHICKKIGERDDLTQAGGGNVSIKFKIFDHTFMIIKSSGVCLGDVDFFYGHSLVSERKGLIWGSKTSIETPVHWVLNKDIVIHCHPQWIFSQQHCTLPYIEPGDDLAKQIYLYRDLEWITLANHGVLLQFDSLSENKWLETLNEKINARDEYRRCNALSSIYNKLVKLSIHFKRYRECVRRLGEEKCKQCYFPDFAVYGQNLIFESNNLYIQGESLRQIAQTDEIVHLHLLCLESEELLNPIESVKIATRKDELYRLKLSELK